MLAYSHGFGLLSFLGKVEFVGMSLRPHQVEAVDAILRGMDVPRGGIPWNGVRGQVIAACGTGKTLIAAESARRLVPHGRVLVLVPTLELLTQTAAAWRAAGHEGTAVAVCSLDDDPVLWELGIRSTTSPPQLALWHRTGPVLMFATYSSMGVVIEACAGTYGQRLGRFDLVVADEAHRTSGSLAKSWADVHDQELLPADRRLYFTATPRVWVDRPPSERVREQHAENERKAGKALLPPWLAASMDDEAVYGPRIFELSLPSSVARGLLAEYRVIVVEVTDPVLPPRRLFGQERREEDVRGDRLAVLQAAVLKTMTEYGLKTSITFHHRTVEARAFAEGLPGTLKKLRKADPEAHGDPVWVDWLSGEHSAERRQEVLHGFSHTAHRAIIAQCKVLGEGVDIRAVDSVVFADPKGAPHDIVQAIGRALRQHPGERKTASLIVPIFLPEGEKSDLSSRAYRPLVQVLRGLRSHDEDALEHLAMPQEGRGYVAPIELGEAPEEGAEDERYLLRFSTRRDPVEIAEFIRYEVIDTERLDWRRGHAAARLFRMREGHVRIPYLHREGTFPLGRWWSEQRTAFAAGRMRGDRAAKLEELGIEWDRAQADIAEHLDAARVYYAEHGTLCVPRDAVVVEKPLGQWISNHRRPHIAARRPEVVAALAVIDPDWNPSWNPDWQRHWAALTLLAENRTRVLEDNDAASDGKPGHDRPETTVNGLDIPPGTTVNGLDVGAWLARQRQAAVWARLVEGQRERLGRYGVAPEETPGEDATAAARPRRAPRVGAFERGLAALDAYLARTGELPQRKAVEVMPDGAEVKVGVWTMNLKSRRERLDAVQLAALAERGVPWAAELTETAGAGAGVR
ncbi:Helicase associated domain protein (plasmid) [Streptomyces sp. BI20]|uniref:DEAD/DEAH box helicase n=1 Tax=Streptomyces sp. BI20 TaxID=3403460 RepID=UPI003C78660D